MSNNKTRAATLFIYAIMTVAAIRFAIGIAAIASFLLFFFLALKIYYRMQGEYPKNWQRD
jgi:hypothetical protein